MHRGLIPAIAFGASVLALGAASEVAAAIFTVVNTNDGGAGSFRQAILDANASPGADLIQFAIPGAGVHTIVTFAPLPVTESALIDGYSQAGSVWNSDPGADNAVLQVELLGQGTDGLTITGGSTIVQGLALQGFQAAIALSAVANNLIQGNFIGTDASGNATFGNVLGVTINGTAGLDRVGDNYPAARNLISGNTSAGIEITGGTGKKILGNLIGTDVTGAAAMPNQTGISLTGSSGIQIGGAPAERNVISGNTGTGIAMTGGDSNEIVGNYVGTDAAGAHALTNFGNGIRADGSAQNFTIAYNVISGNAGDGVSMAFTTGDPTTVQDHVAENFIGTDAANVAPIGNGGAGVRVEFGNVLFVHDNTIAFNQEGVWRISPTVESGVSVSRNAIYSNRGLGIVDGGTPTIAPNLPGSPYNFPRIVSVVSGAGTTTIQAELSGHPNAMVTLEYFSSPACSTVWPSDFDEGRTYIGSSATLSTDGNGHASFSTALPITLTDELVTATAITLLTGFAPAGFQGPTLQTSAFSQRLPFSISPRSGPATGGTGFTISGTDFQPGATVQFGATAVSGVVQNIQQITGTTPALAPGPYGITVTNPDGTHGTLSLGWIADFDDVPAANPFHDFVVVLASDGITAGIGNGLYGVDQAVLRQQMAVFLLKAKHGVCYTPPPCTPGVFADVACPSPFADWIEALAAEGITGGCGGGNYCPTNPVRRDQMAVFLLKAEHGSSYLPPACFPPGVFPDVPCPGTFTDWIEQLAAENITGGCGGGNYCPGNPNTRGQMAVFITKTFNLQ